MTTLHGNDGKPIDESNPLPTKSQASITDSSIIQPIDIQSRFAQTVQTHNAVNVGASSSSDSVWIDTDGFTEVGILVMKDASVSSVISVYFSNDGVTNHGALLNAISNTDNLQSLVLSTRSRYLKVRLQNNDTVAHTMSAWAYLKA